MELYGRHRSDKMTWLEPDNYGRQVPFTESHAEDNKRKPLAVKSNETPRSMSLLPMLFRLLLAWSYLKFRGGSALPSCARRTPQARQNGGITSSVMQSSPRKRWPRCLLSGQQSKGSGGKYQRSGVYGGQRLGWGKMSALQTWLSLVQDSNGYEQCNEGIVMNRYKLKAILY